MSKVIEQLAANLVLHHDYRKGTFKDQSGNSNDGTVAGTPYWHNQAKGRAIFNSKTGDKITVADSAELQLTTLGTIVVFGEFQKQESFLRLLAKRNVTTNYDLYLSGTTVSFYDGANTSAVTVDSIGSKMIATVIDTDSFKVFLDGTLAGESTTTLSMTPADDTVAIGNTVSGTGPVKNSMYGAMIFNVKLTGDQVSQLYDEWMQEGYMLDLPKRNFQLPEGITGNEANLVGGWNMSTQSNIVRDVSVGGNDMTKVGQSSDAEGVFGRAQHISPGGYFNSTVANYRSGDSTGSISAWIKIHTLATDNVIFASSDIGSTQLYFIFRVNSSGKLSFRMLDSSLTEPIGTSVLPVGQWVHVVGTTNGSRYQFYIDNENDPVAAGTDDGRWLNDISGRDNITLGGFLRSSISASMDAELDNVEVFSTELTQAEVTALYNKGAKKLLYRNTFEDVPVTIGATGNEGDDFTDFSGTWKNSVDSTGQKWKECVSAGLAYAHIPFMAGTYQFDLYKETGASVLVCQFIADKIAAYNGGSQDGYNLSFSSAEHFLLGESTNGTPTNLGISSANYIVIQQKYSCRVTRTKAGVFTWYIKGGAFTDWTLADSSVGGSNPVTDTTSTTSKYCVLDFKAGDKVSNFKFFLGVLSPFDFPNL